LWGVVGLAGEGEGVMLRREHGEEEVEEETWATVLPLQEIRVFLGKGGGEEEVGGSGRRGRGGSLKRLEQINTPQFPAQLLQSQLTNRIPELTNRPWRMEAWPAKPPPRLQLSLQKSIKGCFQHQE
jgi:hypothetical protein